MSPKTRGKNSFKAKWLEMKDGNGDLIGSYIRRVNDFSCECSLCSKVIAVSNLGLSAIQRHAKTMVHVSRSKEHVKTKDSENCYERQAELRLIQTQENKCKGQAVELAKDVLLDKIIERLDDFSDLVLFVEKNLHRYHRLRFVLTALEGKNGTKKEHSDVKQGVNAIVKKEIAEDEGNLIIGDEDNNAEEDYDKQIETLKHPNNIIRRGKNHFNEKWLEGTDTNGNNLKTYMEQHDEFSVWCYLCEKAIAIDNQGQSAIMRHIKSQNHSVRAMKGSQGKTEDSFKSIIEDTIDPSSPTKLSCNPVVYKKESVLPKSPIKKRGINHVKDSWFDGMDSNGDPVSLYLRKEGDHHVRCRWCVRSINTSNMGYLAIRRHYQSRSHRAVADMIPDKENFGDGTLDVKNIDFVCDTCGDRLLGLFKFRKHLRNHLADKQVKEVKEHSCPCCAMKFLVDYRTFLKHKRVCEVQHAVGEDFMCSVCGKSFSTYHLMYKHHYRCSKQRSEKRGLKKPCPYEGCVYSSYLSRDLENHVNRVHLKKPLPRNFACHLCGNTYNRKYQLDQHVRGVHMNEKPHKCPVENCTKAFVRRDKLIQHEATHTGEMRHRCPYCEKPFVNNGTMWSHKKMCNFNLTKPIAS